MELNPETLASIPPEKLNQVANLSWHGIAMLVQLIWSRDDAAYDRISKLEREVYELRKRLDTEQQSG